MRIKDIMNMFKSKNVSNISYTQEQLEDIFSTSIANQVSKASILKTSDIIYSATNLISGTISRMSINLYKNVENGKEKVSNDPTLYLLKVRPNQYQTPSDFKVAMISTMLIYGNAYAWIKTNSKGIPTELVILPTTTKLEKVNNTNKYVVKTVVNEQNKVLKYEEVIHLKDLCIGDNMNGISRIDSIISKIETKIQANDVIRKFYTGNSNIKGILNVDGTLSGEAKNKLKKEFLNSLENGIGITEDGIDYTSITTGISLVDQQFAEILQLTNQDIAMIFGLNPALLGNTDKVNYSNLIEIYNQFVQSLVPLITRLEEEISYKMLTKKQQLTSFFKFNVTSMMRASDKDQADYLAKLIEKGIITLNEARQKLDYNSIGDLGDINRVDLNHVSIEVVDNYQLSKAGAKEGGEIDE